MRRYKIGEMAKLLGLTTQALRFYEQEGIVTPYKSENGTRYFTEPDIVRLMAFKRFRLMNFTVQDVADMVEFILSEKASFITGQSITVDGGFAL